MAVQGARSRTKIDPYLEFLMYRTTKMESMNRESSSTADSKANAPSNFRTVINSLESSKMADQMEKVR